MSPRGSGRLPQRRRNQEHTLLHTSSSFSAALLDAIYHSLDADARRAPASPAEIRTTPPSGRRCPSTSLPPPVSSVRSPRLQKPPRPSRVRPDPQQFALMAPPPLPPESTGGSAGKRRNKQTKKNRSAPFACLLNALLCNRKSASAEPTTAVAPSAAAMAEPASARSILSSRASPRPRDTATRGRRAVRFSPVEAVVDEEYGAPNAGTTARLRSAESTEAAAAADADMRVEELLRALGVAEEKEKERAKESSDSSSDLFELEIMTAFDELEMPRARAAGAGDVGLARPRPRVL